MPGAVYSVTQKEKAPVQCCPRAVFSAIEAIVCVMRQSVARQFILHVPEYTGEHRVRIGVRQPLKQWPARHSGTLNVFRPCTCFTQ